MSIDCPFASKVVKIKTGGVDDMAGIAETGTRVVRALLLNVALKTSRTPTIVEPLGFVVVMALAVPRILVVVLSSAFNPTEAS